MITLASDHVCRQGFCSSGTVQEMDRSTYPVPPAPAGVRLRVPTLETAKPNKALRSDA